MLDTTIVTRRRAELEQERESHTVRHVLADRQRAAQIADLETKLAALLAARAEADRQYAERDYGYGAVIGELGKLIDQSLAQAALAARAAEIARVVEAVGDLGDREVRRRRGGG